MPARIDRRIIPGSSAYAKAPLIFHIWVWLGLLIEFVPAEEASNSPLAGPFGGRIGSCAGASFAEADPCVYIPQSSRSHNSVNGRIPYHNSHGRSLHLAGSLCGSGVLPDGKLSSQVER